MPAKNKTKTAYVCTNCGQEFSKWQGKCYSCGEWESIVEFKESKIKKNKRKSGLLADSSELSMLEDCSFEDIIRYPTSLPELDRVLGGGLVAGCVVLLGGDPGIGKSTLLMQLVSEVAKRGESVLYVSGEESAEQLSMRAKRLAVNTAGIHVLPESSVDLALDALEKVIPKVAVVDSIQTMYSDDLESAPGTVSQVRECAAMLLRFAKKNGTTIFLVGHVTKEGAIAGPRVLEHMVDTVLYFEGDSTHQYRILRSVKNRFGPAGEIALFSMHDKGLSEVSNSSEIFIFNRESPQIGAAFIPLREGSRIITVELQALVNKSHFGIPQRVASGVNPKKVSLLLAVLERYSGLSLGDTDVFINVAGGLSISEPAIDLGAVASIMSSFYNKPLSGGLALIGEIGLGGEIRPVNAMAQRLKELASLGFKKCVVPVVEKKSDWHDLNKIITFVPCKHLENLRDCIF